MQWPRSYMPWAIWGQFERLTTSRGQVWTGQCMHEFPSDIQFTNVLLESACYAPRWRIVLHHVTTAAGPIYESIRDISSIRTLDEGCI